MKRVLLTERIHPNAVDMLRQHFEVVQGSGTKDVAEQLKGCQGVLVRSAHVTAADMEKNPQLEVIAKHGMGLDAIDVEAATARGIAVVNAPYANMNAVAEHIVMLILALSKRTVRMDRLTREGQFTQRNVYRTRELKGSTLGIVGLGKISRLVVKKLSGFEMRVIAADPFISSAEAEEAGAHLVSADQLYGESDFVVVHTSLTPSTFHLVGRKEFAYMKPSAYFINASRGAVVDEQALIHALRTGQITGAGLDVFEKEPPSPGNPLLTMDNVIVSPHNAALSDGAMLAMAMDSAQGILDVLEGRVPEHLCNPDVLQQGSLRKEKGEPSC